jgi:hypothetical protein
MSQDVALPLHNNNVVSLWAYTPSPAPPPEPKSQVPHQADYTFVTAPDEPRSKVFASKADACEFLARQHLCYNIIDQCKVTELTAAQALAGGVAFRFPLNRLHVPRSLVITRSTMPNDRRRGLYCYR